jgi:hypothetical protein
VRRHWREHRHDAGLALLTAVVSSLLGGYALRLWKADLGIPFSGAGDGLFSLMEVKGVLDHGWVLSNPDLGAPFGQDLHDFAVGTDFLHLVAVKALGLLSSNPAAVLNAYYLLGFPLAGLAAFLVMRWLGVSGPAAVATSVLFALVPYHFFHGTTFLSAYYTVPVAAYLGLALLLGTPLFARRDGRGRGPLRYVSRRSLLTLALCALVGLSGSYYVAFAALLVIAATALSLLAGGGRGALATGVAVTVLLAATAAATLAPDLLYRAEHGSNRVVAVRSAYESELYALNITQLVMPVREHRVRQLRNLQRKWQGSSLLNKEPAPLGLVGALGFAFLVVLALAVCAGAKGRFASDRRQRALAVASVTALLIGATGGVSALIAYAITPQLRGWSRLSIFIAFFALAAVGLLLDAGRGWLLQRRIGRRGPVCAAVLAGVVLIGLLDQTNASSVPAYSTTAAGYRSDAAFVGRIERSMGQGAMILQLPYLPFPEPGGVERMIDYDLLRPYVHSRELRWSYGAMEGRPQDWHAELANAPTPELVPMVSAAGFDGIYIDRFGYGDNGGLKEAELTQILKAPPVTSPDGRLSFFDLRAYDRELRATHPAAEVRELAEVTVRPLRPEWKATPFFEEVREGLSVSHWTTGQRARLHIVNPSSEERRAALSVTLARPGGRPASAVVRYPGGGRQQVTATPEGAPVQRMLRFRPGLNVIQFSTSASRLLPHVNDQTIGAWLKLVGFRLVPEEAALNG